MSKLVSNIFGGGSSPKIEAPPAPPPPPPPPPAPPAKVEAPPESNAGAKAAEEAARMKRSGRASTILTSGQGVQEDAYIGKKTLLGS